MLLALVVLLLWLTSRGTDMRTVLLTGTRTLFRSKIFYASTVVTLSIALGVWLYRNWFLLHPTSSPSSP